VLITGASSGIGKACAEYLFMRRCRVYGTSRRTPHVEPRSTPPEAVPLFQTIPLDITSDESVEKAVSLVLESEGRIDAVVNNAGFGLAGAVESTSIAEAREQFETNFFGTMRVCRAVLPAMRRQGHGHILNVSSVAGQIGIPFQGIYSATKFAVEGLTEALRLEVAPFGIRVVLIEPGDFHTGFTANRRRTVGGDAAVYAQRRHHDAVPWGALRRRPPHRDGRPRAEAVPAVAPVRMGPGQVLPHRLSPSVHKRGNVFVL
jgi:NAD(P)-dependent dehydrogenase (short-subunit alcohol dehydrogenase family)